MLKNPLGFLAMSIGSGTFSEGIEPSSTTEAFLILVLKFGNVYRRGFDILLRPSTDDTVAI